MHTSSRAYLMCLACVCFASVCTAVGTIGYGRPAVVPIVRRPITIIPEYISANPTGEAKAVAQSSAARAAATAAKIDAIDWRTLNQYGWESGQPLLSQACPPLDNLYAASLPARSFVANLEPSFQKDAWNNVKHRTASSLGVAALP